MAAAGCEAVEGGGGAPACSRAAAGKSSARPRRARPSRPRPSSPAAPPPPPGRGLTSAGSPPAARGQGDVAGVRRAPTRSGSQIQGVARARELGRWREEGAVAGARGGGGRKADASLRLLVQRDALDHRGGARHPPHAHAAREHFGERVEAQYAPVARRRVEGQEAGEPAPWLAGPWDLAGEGPWAWELQTAAAGSSRRRGLVRRRGAPSRRVQLRRSAAAEVLGCPHGAAMSRRRV